MIVEHVKYKETSFFSKLIIDYIEKHKDLDTYISYDNSISGFKKTISARNKIFTDRNLLVSRLKKQNSNIKLSKKTTENIHSILSENTFTITAGHQLNYFTGPLYYIYKISSTIKLCEELKAEFPKNNFVPIFWMATEDHDLEEVNNFEFQGETFSWNTAQKGAIGRMNIDNIRLEEEKLFSKLKQGKRAEYLKQLFSKSYLSSKTVAQATRILINELFGENGIVIIDGDDRYLKKTMVNIYKKELTNFVSDNNLKQTNEELKNLNYKIQVNQRKINLFYLDKNLRERIILENKKYKVLNTNIEFSEEEILEELENNPEKFSPNAILRPLYQEKILPNIACVGGGGEIAYWLQLKRNFDSNKISFPILILRNSILLINEKQHRAIKKINISTKELFKSVDYLIKKKIIENANINIDFTNYIDSISNIFYDIFKHHKKDISLQKTIKAEFKKQLNGIYNLEKKVLKVEKKKQLDLVMKIERLKTELFPKNILQERCSNLSTMYMNFGEALIPQIINNIKVLDSNFTVMYFKEKSLK